jgi:hypothetical protein
MIVSFGGRGRGQAELECWWLGLAVQSRRRCLLEDRESQPCTVGVLRPSTRDMVPPTHVDAALQRDAGIYSIVMRLWNHLEPTLDLD